MTLQVVGAGLGRTGTVSLKGALERLLGGPCYHMVEVFAHLDDDVPRWHAAVRGEPVDWEGLLGGYRAAVDWPAAAFWRELAECYPGAIVLLSTREDAEAWWRSADRTVLAVMRRPAPPHMQTWDAMIRDLWQRTMGNWDDQEVAMAAYDRHNEAVRAAIAPERLVEWRPGDGWGPLCEALGVPVPDEPFPHENTTADFRAMASLDET